ncbi:hypothetical protein B0H14DRAFT_3150919 [Mycena olivaceomarginata]|nr:hypothetical protein B0H14DRAFT_3150919 [Mycena olivaceomarginata]
MFSRLSRSPDADRISVRSIRIPMQADPRSKAKQLIADVRVVLIQDNTRDLQYNGKTEIHPPAQDGRFPVNGHGPRRPMSWPVPCIPVTVSPTYHTGRLHGLHNRCLARWCIGIGAGCQCHVLLIRETDEDRKISTFSGARTNPLRIRTGITYSRNRRRSEDIDIFWCKNESAAHSHSFESPTQAGEYGARGKFKVDAWTDGWNASRSYATQRADGVDGKPTKIGRYFLVQERVIRTARRKSPSIRHLPAREGRPY